MNLLTPIETYTTQLPGNLDYSRVLQYRFSKHFDHIKQSVKQAKMTCCFRDCDSLGTIAHHALYCDNEAIAGREVLGVHIFPVCKSHHIHCETRDYVKHPSKTFDCSVHSPKNWKTFYYVRQSMYSSALLKDLSFNSPELYVAMAAKFRGQVQPDIFGQFAQIEEAQRIVIPELFRRMRSYRSIQSSKHYDFGIHEPLW